MNVRSCAVSLLAAALCGLAMPAAHAEMRALLVGVTGYPTLPEQYHLQGPRNDVQRMRDVLQQRGFAPAQIQVLADGVPGAQLPTRANIFAALEALAKSARAGDVVYLHFAGHGSQQPVDRKAAAGKDEPDGLDEIFLPIDVGSFEVQAGARGVKNAIVDDELSAAVDRINEGGAFVWGVFDACHSATLVRGTEGTEVRYRHVDPAALGIQPADIEAARAAAPRTRGEAPPDAGPLGEPQAGKAGHTGKAGAVFFYAAQTTELTPELRLPFEDPQRQPYGLFGFTLARALELGQAMSYRQLAQYVLAQYGSISEARVTPVFSGTDLDQPVFGQQTVPVRQWPLVRDGKPSVPVGLLSGIGEGAIFSIVPGPLAKVDEVRGHLRATAVQVARAELEPVAYGGMPPPAAADIPPGSFARLVTTPPQFSLRVAVDTSACGSNCPATAATLQLKAKGVPGTDVRWVERHGGPDILVKALPDRVVFLPPSQQSDDRAAVAQALGFKLADGAGTPAALQVRIGDWLHAIARANNLMRLASRFVAQAKASGLSVTVKHLPAAGRATQRMSTSSVSKLRDGDGLVLTIENKGLTAQDVTVLYAEADFGIVPLFPRGDGEVNRLEPGSVRVIDDIKIGARTVGIEKLMLISVEAQKHAERADFSFLAQPSLVRSRSGGSEDLDAFLDAAFAEYRSRDVARAAAPSARTDMQVFTFNIQP